MTAAQTEPSRGGLPARLRAVFGDRSRGDDPRFVAFAAFAIFTGFAGDFWRNLTTWAGFGVVVALVFAGAIAVLAIRRPPLRLSHLPFPLLVFVVWCLASTLWSAYWPETLLASAAQLVTAFIGVAIAVTSTMPMLLRAFSLAMRGIVAMSLLFELIVAVFFPGGVLPLYLLLPGVLDSFTGVPGSTIETAPAGFQWSQGNLFANAAIQGITGNRNLLAMVALLAAIAVGVQFAAKQLGRWNALTWIVVSLGTVVLCRSMTVIASTGIVLFAAVLIRVARPLSTRRRWMLYGGVGTLMVVTAFVVVRFNDELFGLINRSSDMSGRGDIWWAVTEIAAGHPVAGIGWISYWAPWVEPYRGLLVVDGIQYLQAHNAYIDVWLQTGFIGVAMFLIFVVSTLIRTWWLAISSDSHDTTHIPHSATLAFLVMVALTVQSLTESRLLIEGNWLMLVCFAVASKLRIQDLPALPRRTIASLTGPITVIDSRTLEPRPVRPTVQMPVVRPPAPGGAGADEPAASGDPGARGTPGASGASGAPDAHPGPRA